MRAMRICSSAKNIQRRILQQHDGLGVRDAAVADHGQRLIDRQFQHLDVLALVERCRRRCRPSSAGSYSATKKCSFSVTEPGLMKASNTFVISPSR